MIIKPSNGKYLTKKDSLSFSNLMEEFFIEKHNCENVTFIVTERCNLACKYCYELNKSKHTMSWDVAKAGVDMLFDKSKINGYFDWDNTKGIILEFIGGEPLLEIELIDKICDYFKYKCFKENPPWKDMYMFSMTSNGILYDIEPVQKYMNKNKNKVSLSISVDGNKKLHDSCRIFPNGQGSYNVVSLNVKKFLKDYPFASTKVTFSPDNINYVYDAVINLKEEFGFVFIHANCVFEEGWNNSHAKIFEDQLKLLADYIIDNDLYDKFYVSLFDDTVGNLDCDLDKNWCGGNGEMIAIGTNGDCYPCVRFAPISLSKNRKPLIFGNVYNGLIINENQSNTFDKLKKVTTGTQSTKECLKCSLSSGCGLCLGYNYDKFGDFNKRATYICCMHKARVRANKYYWEKLWSKLESRG